MAAQSTEIDNVSGATITTNAVKKAAASCIEQAMGVHTAGATPLHLPPMRTGWVPSRRSTRARSPRPVDVDVAVVAAAIGRRCRLPQRR